MEFVESHLFCPQGERNLPTDFSGALDSDKPQTARLPLDVNIDRDTHCELIGDLTLFYEVHLGCLTTARIPEVVIEIVMGDFPAVHPFVEEPIHRFLNVFLNDIVKIVGPVAAN
jgi:hypothetical protein